MAPRPRERDVEEDRDDVVDVSDPTKKPDSMLADGDELDDEGIDNAIAKKQAELEAAAKARQPAPRDQEDEDDEDARLAYDDDEGSGGGERGTGRRARRNRAAKRALEQSQQRIEQLATVVAQQQASLDRISRGQLGLAAGDIDGQIATLSGHLESIDAAISDAISAGDGAKHRQAMRLRDEARDRIQQLNVERYRLETVARQTGPAAAPQPQNRPAAPAPDPAAVRYSETFLRRHDWFDPDDPTDEDSQVVKAIDDTLANEGYKSSEKRYWIELEKRVAARGLGRSSDDGEDEEQEDLPEPRTERRRPTGGLPPRSRGTGGGGVPRRNTVQLTDMMKDALDSEGLLETKGLTTEQLNLRRKYVKTWSDGMKAAESAARR